MCKPPSANLNLVMGKYFYQIDENEMKKVKQRNLNLIWYKENKIGYKFDSLYKTILKYSNI